DGWQEYHRAAGLLARCVPLAEKDDKLSEEKGKELAQAYGKQAVELLRRAVEKGFKDAAGLKKDPAFAAGRARADFQKLLSEMGGRPHTGRSTPPRGEGRGPAGRPRRAAAGGGPRQGQARGGAPWTHSATITGRPLRVVTSWTVTMPGWRSGAAAGL